MGRKSKHAPNWVSVKALYLAGATTKELSKQFNIPETTIKSRATRHSWVPRELPPRILERAQDQITKSGEADVDAAWLNRAALIREKEFQASRRVLEFTEKLDEPDLLKNMDRIKTAADMGRRAVGLDEKQTSGNAINIAVLGDIGIFDEEAKLFSKSKEKIINLPAESGNP